jgi:hypothetical protein
VRRLYNRAMKQVGIAFLVLQVILVLAARFTPLRYFCWAPHAAQVEFFLDVEVAGRKLTREQVQQRYRFAWSDRWEAHAAANLIDTVRRYETTYGNKDGARASLRYRVNGGKEQTWCWPE